MSANAYLIHAVTFVRNVALLLREKNVVMAGGVVSGSPLWGGAEPQHQPPPGLSGSAPGEVRS